MSATEDLKVLIADEDGVHARRVSSYLASRGFNVRLAATAPAAREVIDEWQPRFVLADLMLPDGGALSLIDHVRFMNHARTPSRVPSRSIGLIVMSGHSAEKNVREVVARGARDYLVKPFSPGEAYRRLLLHARAPRRLDTAALNPEAKGDEAGLMLQLTDLILQQALRDTDLEEILYNLTRMVNLRLGGVRCSLVHCVDQRSGVVVCSDDDREASGIRVDLYKYPELGHVMNVQRTVAIEDLSDQLELRGVREHLRDIHFNSMIVCPVSRRNSPFGALSLRLAPGRAQILDHEIRFVEIVAQVISLVLNGQRHQVARDFWDRPDPRGTLHFPRPLLKNS